MSSAEHISQIINDVDDYIQRNGLITNKILIRTKLRLLNTITPLGKTKTIIRGLLIRMNRISAIELTLRVMDILKTLIKERNVVKSVGKIYLQRFVKPKDIVNWFESENYPLKLEYC